MTKQLTTEEIKYWGKKVLLRGNSEAHNSCSNYSTRDVINAGLKSLAEEGVLPKTQRTEIKEAAFSEAFKDIPQNLREKFIPILKAQKGTHRPTW
jgi:hypothetical protein